MAGLKNSDDFKSGERFRGAGLWGYIILGIGVIATLAFFLIAYFVPETKSGVKLADAMAFSWLFAVIFFLSLAVGGMFWTLLHHASNSGWGALVRRLMENLGIMIPVMFFMALPLVLEPFHFRNVLWEWFQKRASVLDVAEKRAEAGKEAYIKGLQDQAAKFTGEIERLQKEKSAAGALTPGNARFFDDKITALTREAAKVAEHASQKSTDLLAELKDKEFQKEDSLLYTKRNFLEPNFWLGRFVFYVLVLAGGMFVLRSCSIRQDKTGEVRLFTKMQTISCLILLPFAVCWTFLVFDWLMALDYTWFSTMWGVYLFAGAALNSMGFLILMLTALRKAGYFKHTITKEHYHTMGKLMHAFVIFWAYIAFSQFFLIWYANITEETKFFLIRNTDGWNLYTIMFLVVGHFFIPFVTLLIRYHKTTVWIICCVAGWNLLMHFFDLYWIVIADRAPSLTSGAVSTIPGMWVYDLLAFVGVGGIFIFALLKALGSASLFPCRDPRLDESLNLSN
jgi:hypothetical protein